MHDGQAGSIVLAQDSLELHHSGRGYLVTIFSPFGKLGKQGEARRSNETWTQMIDRYTGVPKVALLDF